MRLILHIDLNSYFATVEQQANPRLRGKPIGVTGGDRMERTVLGTASIEAKKLGVKTGMPIYEARKICPDLILVRGDSDKYLSTTKQFLNILKDYSPFLEIFSIDESFLELESTKSYQDALDIGVEIKQRIRSEIGEWVSCSIGISYNRLMAKLASDLQKPNGLVVIADQASAEWILDRVDLDEICGIGSRIKKRLLNMGVSNFQGLRKLSLEALLASFKSYGQILFNMSRGIDHSSLVSFYDKEEVKSVGHRHTLNHNTKNPEEIRQLLLKLTELIARRVRSKKLVGKTVSCWYRGSDFSGNGGQATVKLTDDGLEIYKAAWELFLKFWQREEVRMVGTSLSNLTSKHPQNLSLLEDEVRQEKIIQKIDIINDRYGEFTLKRGVLIKTQAVARKPNPFLADRRFKI